MSISAAKENLLTLAHRLGLAHSQVDTLMEQNIRIVHDSASDHIELAFAVQNMLSRSFTSVELGEAGEDTSVLIVIGDAPARAGLKACYAQLLGDRVRRLVARR